MKKDNRPSYSLGEKAVFYLVVAVFSLYLLPFVTRDLWPAPARRVQGFVVAKTWTPRTRGPKGRIWPASFRVSVANAESVRSFTVDSLSWAGYRLGQPASYRFQPRRFWE